MKIILKAKSSSGDPYDVIFTVEDNLLTVHCNCKAGEFGQGCKHKTELMAGIADRLADPSQLPLLEQVAGIVAKAPELHKFAEQILEYEKLIEEAESRQIKVKKKLAESLRNGISIEA